MSSHRDQHRSIDRGRRDYDDRGSRDNDDWGRLERRRSISSQRESRERGRDDGRTRGPLREFDHNHQTHSQQRGESSVRLSDLPMEFPIPKNGRFLPLKPARMQGTGGTEIKLR